MKKPIITLFLMLGAICAMQAQTEKKQKQDTTIYHQDKNAIRNSGKGDTINKPVRYPADTTQKNFPPHEKVIKNDNTRTESLRIKADTVPAKRPK